MTCSKRGGASNQIHGMGGGAALTAPTVQFQLDPRLLALQSPSITKHIEKLQKKKGFIALQSHSRGDKINKFLEFLILCCAVIVASEKEKKWRGSVTDLKKNCNIQVFLVSQHGDSSKEHRR